MLSPQGHHQTPVYPRFFTLVTRVAPVFVIRQNFVDFHCEHQSVAVGGGGFAYDHFSNFAAFRISGLHVANEQTPWNGFGAKPSSYLTVYMKTSGCAVATVNNSCRGFSA